MISEADTVWRTFRDINVLEELLSVYLSEFSADSFYYGCLLEALVSEGKIEQATSFVSEASSWNIFIPSSAFFSLFYQCAKIHDFKSIFYVQEYLQVVHANHQDSTFGLIQGLFESSLELGGQSLEDARRFVIQSTLSIGNKSLTKTLKCFELLCRESDAKYREIVKLAVLDPLLLIVSEARPRKWIFSPAVLPLLYICSENSIDSVFGAFKKCMESGVGEITRSYKDLVDVLVRYRDLDSLRRLGQFVWNHAPLQNQFCFQQIAIGFLRFECFEEGEKYIFHHPSDQKLVFSSILIQFVRSCSIQHPDSPVLRRIENRIDDLITVPRTETSTAIRHSPGSLDLALELLSKT